MQEHFARGSFPVRRLKIKRISSKRAKSTQISTKTKKAVYERDNRLCVVCGRYGLPEAHYVPRSQGGLGTEQNIVTLCRECHEAFDHKDYDTRMKYGRIIRLYLQKKYPDIEYPEDRCHPGNSDLVYKKYGGIFDEA